MKINATKGIILISILSSCNVAYRSMVINNPLFSAKKQLALTATTTNLQAAYSVTDHIGVMANTYFEQQQISIDRTGNGGYGIMGEGGIGYFKKLYNKPEIIFETYTGLGYGHLNLVNNYTDPAKGYGVQQSKLNADGLKFFFQPAIGYKLPHFEIAAAVRYSQINYLNVATANFSNAQLYDAKLDELNVSYHFIEPAITIRAGIRNVKLQFQYLYCIKLNHGSINYNHELYSLGVFIKLHTDKHLEPLKNLRL